MGLYEPSRTCSHLTPSKRGRLTLFVSSTRVLWLLGWNEALTVCQWEHEHIAERVSGISAANRFSDLVAMPPLSPLVYTEYVDNFVAPSQQESVARDAAERVSDALFMVGFDCWSVSLGALAPPYCHASCRTSGLGERGRNKVVGSPLHVSGFGESSWLHSARLPPSLNAEAGKDDACGCPSFRNFGWPRV